MKELKLKRRLSLVCVLFLSSLAFGGTASWPEGWPDGWPSTNKVSCLKSYDGDYNVRMDLARRVWAYPTGYHKGMPDLTEAILKYAERNAIHVSNIVYEAAILFDEGQKIKKLEKVVSDKGKRDLSFFCTRLLVLIAGTRDKSSMPFLKEKAESQEEWIRETASIGIIDSLKLESLPFMRLWCQDKERGRDEFHSLYYSFCGTLRKVKEDNPEANLDEAYIFLLEQMEAEPDVGKAKYLDENLCKTIDGYSASVQRRRAAMRLSKKGVGVPRSHFAKAKKEIEKKPESELVDFSKKGRLLDPDRKRRMKDRY